jgi:pimeloyl-ACP methyl ester carboxylesterase
MRAFRPCSSRVSEVLFGALAVAGLLVAYGLLAGALARRWAFQASDRVHRLLPLPTPGHHAALVHHPPAGPARAAPPVIVCHGMAVNGLCMDALDDGHGSPRLSLARTLAAAGFDVWALELRGRGRAAVPRGARWTVDDEVGEDVPAAIAAVLESTGASEVWWVGHSKGALVQYLFQATGHALAPRVTALVAIGSPGTVRFQRRFLRWLVPPLSLWARVVGDVPLSRAIVLLTPLAHLTRWLGRPIDTLVRENDGASLGRLFASIFADVNRGVVEQMLRWVAHPDGALVAMDGRRYDEGFGRLRMPLYLLAGAADRLVPPAAVAYVRDRVSSTDVTFEVVGVAGGASHDYGHGDLVLGARAPEDVFARVVRWLGARAGGAPIV